MAVMDKIIEAGRDTLQAGRARVTGMGYGMEGLRKAPVDTMRDEETRRQQGYHEVEAGLPKNIAGSHKVPILDKVLALAFGDKNPMAQKATAKTDLLWLLDNTAYRPDGNESAHWEAEFVAAYFKKDSGKTLTNAVANIADKLGVDDGHLGEKPMVTAKIEERLKPFALATLPARYVNVAWAGERTRTLGPGNVNAISSQTLGQLGFREAGEVIETSPVEEGLAPHAPMSTYFVEPEGWTVISDIDDSIKITMTPSPIGVLQSTFYDDPQVIAGMPELYRHIQGLLKPNWFYLSASPYNLYTFLRPFLREHYPHGTIILRDASWQNLDGLLQSFTIGTEAYKTSRIEKIHSWLPRKKVLCVGDSTQSDPEAYGDMYRKFGPDWIKAIYIRKVSGVKGVDATVKNAPERFEKAFKDVPESVWRVFEDPNELYQAVDSLSTI